MLNRQSQIKTTASTGQNEKKKQLKIANYVTVGKKTLTHLTANASLNVLYKSNSNRNNFEQPRNVYRTNRKRI